MSDVFLGRQPIYDRQSHIFAYELLFRSSNHNRAVIEDPDRATTELIINTLTQFGLTSVVGEAPAFINLTENFILGKLPLPGSSQHLVLEILETITITPEVIDGILRLKTQGFRIALDDFIYHAELAPLVQAADIIKLDVLSLGHGRLREHVKVLRAYPVKLLAEKVETHEDHQLCMQLGFDYFQGYFLCKPNVLQSHHLPANRLALLKLIARISDPNIEADEVTQLVSQDVTLSFRLLRYINSSHYALDHKIESIKSAVLLLGLSTLRNLISLLLITSIHDKPPALFVTAFIRAHMCEQISMRTDKKMQARYFTVGLFSVIDAILDRPISEILAQLPLDDTITNAIINYEGNLGRTLQSVIAYERGDWEHVNLPGCAIEEIRTIYLNALQYGSDFIQSINQANAA